MQRRSSSEERFLKIDAAIHTKKGEMKEILSDHYEIVEAYEGRMALDIIDRESKTVSGVRTDEGTDRCHCGCQRASRYRQDRDSGFSAVRR